MGGTLSDLHGLLPNRFELPRAAPDHSTMAQLARQTVAIVLAGGRGTRLGALTEWRAKPAVPFGGKFRIIDFALSNCLNSGLRRIGIATQYQSHGLIHHLQRGWSFLDGRFNEFIELLPAQQTANCDWYKGTADAVYQNIDVLRRHGARYVLVLAGDHIYKMNYTCMLHEHVEHGAASFEEKPAKPRHTPTRPGYSLGSMGIYVFNTDFLAETLVDDAMDESSGHDFGHDIIPKIMKSGACVYAHSLKDSCVQLEDREPYWRDVGTVDAFWEANIELTRVTPALNLYDETWPIWTYQEQLPPAKFVFDIEGRRGAAIDSMVSGGCIISGSTVRNSLLFSSVRVHSYCDVTEAVLLPNVEVGRGAVLKRVIVDQATKIPAGLTAGVDPAEDRKRFHVTQNGITLVTPSMLGQIQRHLH